MPTRASGLTLIEVLVVITLLAILASVVIPRYGDVAEDARETVLKADLATMRQQLQLYRVNHGGAYPTSLNQLTKKTDTDGADGEEFGPYLMALPINPFTETNDTQTETKGEGTQAWYYDSATGEFAANDAEHLDW